VFFEQIAKWQIRTLFSLRYLVKIKKVRLKKGVPNKFKLVLAEK
jgi:hypothetical protein